MSAFVFFTQTIDFFGQSSIKETDSTFPKMIEQRLEHPSTIGGMFSKNQKLEACRPAIDTLCDKGVINRAQSISALLQRPGRTIVLMHKNLSFTKYSDLCQVLIDTELAKGTEVFFNLFNAKNKKEATL